MKKCALLECRSPLAKSWHLLCPNHWAIVPHELQDAVYREYKRAPGSPEHWNAMSAAKAAARAPEVPRG